LVAWGDLAELWELLVLVVLLRLEVLLE